MPKNNVTDPITDQEIAFARLVLSGTMTDRRAAEAVGLEPDSAAYTKSKPRVRDYMLLHRAAVQQQLVEQDTQELRRLNLGREQILGRLWEIANLDPDRTRGSASAQVKALSMIVAIEGLIPDHRAGSAQNKSAPPPVNSQIYAPAWPPRPSRSDVEPAVARTQQHGQSQPPPAPPVPACRGAQEVAAPDLSSRLSRQAVERAVGPERSGVEGPAVPIRPIPHPTLDPGESNFSGPLSPSQTPSSPHTPMSATVPDIRVPFSINKNSFARRR
jgi:hypothetical protein